MNTLKKIAEDLGVSVSTVSYVHNNKWRQKRIKKESAEKIKKVLKERNYRPNTLGLQLKTKKTKTVGVVLVDLTKTFGLDILAGVEKVVTKSGYFTLVCGSGGYKEREQLQILLARNVEGVIVSPLGDETIQESVKRFIADNVPIVLVDNYLPELKTDFVVSDNFWGAYKATTYLINKGCKKIGFIGGELIGSASRERFEGYSSALRKKGLSVSENLIYLKMTRKMIRPEESYSAMEKIFTGGKPDGVFVESFLYFKGGLQFLAEKKVSVPDDLHLIGFDPLNLTPHEIQKLHFHSLVRKPLPFIEQDGTRMGELATKILLRKIKRANGNLSACFLKPKLKFFSK